MSILAGVGTSNAFDSDSAAVSSLEQATKNLGDHTPNLILIFASPTKYNQEQILRTIKDKSPNAQIIGCSTSGEISSIEGPQDGSIAVMAIYSDQIKFVISKSEALSSDTQKVCQDFANNILQQNQNLKPHASLMLTDGLVSSGSEILKGILEIFGSQTALVGGAAGDDFQFKKTYQYFNNELLTGAMVGVGMYGKFNYGIGVRHGWIPIGTSRVVTKATLNLLQELDGKPAIAIYEDQFGKDKTTMKEDEPFAKLAITYPLGISLPGEREFLIRDPLRRTEFGEIICTADIPLGSEVYIMIGNREEALSASIDAAKQAMLGLNGKQPKLAILFSCIARKKLLMNKRKDEINEIRKIIGEDIPLVGFYAYGEIAPNGPTFAGTFHNETNVIFLLAE